MFHCDQGYWAFTSFTYLSVYVYCLVCGDLCMFVLCLCIYIYSIYTHVVMHKWVHVCACKFHTCIYVINVCAFHCCINQFMPYLQFLLCHWNYWWHIIGLMVSIWSGSLPVAQMETLTFIKWSCLCGTNYTFLQWSLSMLVVLHTTSLVWHPSLGIQSKCVPTLLDVVTLRPWM